MFRRLGFERITAVRHRDRALEYGKDVSMRVILPTRHVFCFGIRAKRRTLDAAGTSRGGHANVVGSLNQARMMLGHEVVDPGHSRRALVDHALIVAGDPITKAARSWLGNGLDVPRRSQILFMDRNDILGVFATSNAPLPEEARATPPDRDGEFPF